MTRLSRRRFLSISAACAVASGAARAAADPARWRGVALGAAASMRIEGLAPRRAGAIFAEVEAELARLEGIFSLYRPESELARLNRDGRIAAPSAELLDVLSLSAVLHDASGGAFDPTVQPLWLALARGESPDEARRLVGFERLKFDAGQVWFEGRDAAGRCGITLNGIAQGAITDRIAALLRRRGLRDVLIDMGEIAALGRRGDGADWRVGVAGSDGAVLRELRLTDRAVATSSSLGTLLAPGLGHIVDPRGQRPVGARIVSVSAGRAVLADGLSTALCLVPERDAGALVAQFPGARLEVFEAEAASG